MLGSDLLRILAAPDAGIPPGVFFRLPILLLAVAGATHSPGYLRGHGDDRMGLYFFFYNLTAAAMLAVTLAEHPIAFLTAWELMGLASFALVGFDYRADTVRKAAWIYLAACQAGGATLIALFLFPLSPVAVFVLAVIGFGLKIGFPALHVWLPEAHPAAPAPVSALMSGAMIQLGFYGILRWGATTPEYAALYGWTLLTLGLVGALGGILFALGQNNLKKLLAYSSIENMGIVGMGFGLGFLGNAAGNAPMALCGFGGAFLHMLNHALLKGGLFLGAGAVLKSEGTLDMDRMGGLLRRAPVTGKWFLLNSAGICGLPPFNGFVGEFLIYLGAFAALAGKSSATAAGVTVLIVLALTGGLAAAAFAKAGGAVFLGEPRTPDAARAAEPARSMAHPVAALFGLGCAVMIFASPLAGRILAGLDRAGFIPGGMAAWPEIGAALWRVAIFSVGSTLLFGLLLTLRNRLVRRNGTRVGPTWDCGYAAPDARMEYTGTAFTQPLTDFFAGILRPRRKTDRPDTDYFPRQGSYEQEIPDAGLARLWSPVFRAIESFAGKIHFLQSGYLHFYVLIMALALLAMLIWGLVLPWAGTFLKGGC